MQAFLNDLCLDPLLNCIGSVGKSYFILSCLSAKIEFFFLLTVHGGNLSSVAHFLPVFVNIFV